MMENCSQPKQLSHWVFPIFLLFIPTIFAVDSQWLSERVTYNQWMANGICLTFFLFIYRQATQRLRKLMLYGIPIAMFGETLFSLILGMYEYRLGNIPLYVFLGHSVVYASVYLLMRSPRIKQLNPLQPLLLSLASGLVIFWWLTQNDWFGLCCFLGFLAFYRASGENRTFYLVMFCIVAYLELVGTYFGCWQWPAVWFGVFEWMPSGNPPIGIALFYFLFDLGCLWVYKHRNLLAWKRMRYIQRLNG